MNARATRVRDALLQHGIEVEFRRFPQGTRTAVEAAAALETSVARIAKSLVFQAGDELVLVIASGANRVDLERLGRLVGARVERADPRLVKERTGFPIGGVPPVGHAVPLRTFIDRDLLAQPEIFAAAGSPDTLFRTTPADLLRVTGGRPADVGIPL